MRQLSPLNIHDTVAYRVVYQYRYSGTSSATPSDWSSDKCVVVVAGRDARTAITAIEVASQDHDLRFKSVEIVAVVDLIAPDLMCPGARKP